MKNGYLKEEDLERLDIQSNTTTMSKKEVETIFESMRLYELKNRNIFAQFGFKNKLDGDLCLRTTGLNLDEFFSLSSQLVSIKDSPVRTKDQSLAVYLFWLKTGLDQQTIATYFGNIDRFQVKNYCAQSRKALIKDFVSSYLGSKNKKRYKEK